MSLTTLEKNLACIYYGNSREDTVAQLREGLPHITEPDTLAAAHTAIAKLDSMSDMEFTLSFRGVML